MSYSINIQKILQDSEFDNLTHAAATTPENLVQAYKDGGYTEIDISPSQYESNLEAAEAIMQTDAFYEIEEQFYPIYNYAHVLQNKPSDDAIEELLMHAPNVAIIYVEELSTHLITLTGCGMDMSDSIAYAYARIDHHIPQCFSNIEEAHTISEYALHEIKELQS